MAEALLICAAVLCAAVVIVLVRAERPVREGHAFRFRRTDISRKVDGDVHTDLLKLKQGSYEFSVLLRRVEVNVNTHKIEARVVSRKRLRNPTPAVDFPRLWRGIGYFLPPKVRKRTFVPALEHLVDLYLDAVLEHRRGGLGKGLMFVAFTVQTVWLVFGCLWVEVRDLALPWLTPRSK